MHKNGLCTAPIKVEPSARRTHGNGLAAWSVGLCGLLRSAPKACIGAAARQHADAAHARAWQRCRRQSGATLRLLSLRAGW
eukprot:356698-Chlamydomonas_euryale.AAC.10